MKKPLQLVDADCYAPAMNNSWPMMLIILILGMAAFRVFLYTYRFGIPPGLMIAGIVGLVASYFAYLVPNRRRPQ
jgi:hypothetical protein